ncbi:MAG: PilT/PilU family type 4a pilus ATPase [Cypionkella sp.]
MCPLAFRVDGQLRNIEGEAPLQSESTLAAIHALMPEDAVEVYEADRQLDFAFSWRSHSRFVLTPIFSAVEPALALRLIPAEIPAPEQLGLPEVCQRLVTLPHGLVLVTGPTGSGKSTSLAAMVQHIARTRPCHILTIEDPVEYLHSSNVALVNQREVGEDCTSFAQALRAALREDPDVVLVGELRDLETIALTLTLAETGHLVFGTLHTNDSSQTVDRIIDVFPTDQQSQVRTQLSMSLAAVIAQRLIPRIGGGRVAAFEVLTGSSAVSNLIREGKSRQLRNVIATSSRDGMQLLEQSLSRLVSEGLVSLEDAKAISMYPDEIVQRPMGAGINGLQPGIAAGQR